MTHNIRNHDMLIVNIQQTVNLLTCFEDFCEFEGDFDQCDSPEDVKDKAIIFAERLKYFDSLLFASKSLLKDVLKNFQSYEEEKKYE